MVHAKTRARTHTHTHAHNGISHYCGKLTIAQALTYLNIPTHTGLHRHTHPQAHAPFRGTFVEVKGAINETLLNHKTRAKLSPLH